MTGVDKTNQLDRNPRLYQLQRVDARFINTGMMITLSGDFVSDSLADGRVVSGVGGQYNRSEEHTSELQSLMRISYAVFCLKKKSKVYTHTLGNTLSKI